LRPLSDNEPVPGLEKRRVLARGGDPRRSADYVLFWMQVRRRAEQNLALDEAIREANRLRLPVLVYEGLRPDYPGANRRLHTFVAEGMRENARTAAARGLQYVAYVPAAGEADRDTLARLARRAALVVTDECPGFIFDHQTAALARRLDCPLVAVDTCGVVPLREFAKREWSAATIRPKIRALLDIYLRPQPDADVRTRADGLVVDLPGATDVERRTPAEIVERAGVDPTVAPAPDLVGGRAAGLARLSRFVAERLDGYADRRNRAALDATSGLSPYLHFGFVSPLEVALAVRDAGGPAEDTSVFLEELIVRRELSHNFVFHEPRHTRVDALPDWARTTLEKHASDTRQPVREDEIERGETYDDVWNVAQRELLATGVIHNYARMLWGKKILEWASTPQRAADLMVRLHDRYALDGRDPATYTNVLWCLGLHDRAWGPERPVFGTVRYMSSDSFRRKHDVKAYAARVARAEARANGDHAKPER
jgi:deoxyribodipyrimidine photo-lyase